MRPLLLALQKAKRRAEPRAKRRKVTLRDIQANYKASKPITVLTAHDYASATYLEAAAKVDICLVGDSLAMVACGYASTVSLTLDEMLYHCRAVARGCTTPLLVGDMPYGTYHTSLERATENALRLVQEGNMEAVKLEGGVELVPLIRHLTSFGIPVMGHVGLTPQRQSALSGYRVQGKTAASAVSILKDAKAVAEAGAFSLVLEAMPSRLGRHITSQLDVPTIGIGAGAGCSGQVLVQQDALGGFDRFAPRFAKRYMDLHGEAAKAIGSYANDVKSGTFPNDEEHGYAMKEEDFVEYERLVERGEGELR